MAFCAPYESCLERDLIRALRQNPMASNEQVTHKQRSTRPEMKIFARFASLLVLAFYLSFATAAPTAQEAAADLVARRDIGNNLRLMSLELAATTQTYLMIVAKIGPVAARSSVAREIDALIPNYQARWNHELAVVYARHLPLEALISLTAEGRESKYASKLADKLNDIGEDMRVRSTPILIELLSAAMLSAFSKVSPSN